MPMYLHISVCIIDETTFRGGFVFPTILKRYLSQKSYQQVFCLFSLFSSDGFKGFFRFYKRDFISLKKQVKTAFCFYRVATFPFIRLQESPDKESPSVPAEHERK